MRRADFEAMVRGMAAEMPPAFVEGILEIAVTGKTVPHPLREGVYTLGECLPHEFGSPGEEDAGIRSSVVLHFGSFAALAREHGEGEFDWREEAFETLAHEVRHHLEWRARVPELEKLDDAAEANYARHDGEPFPPLFYRDGERVGEGVWKVEDDVFLEVLLPRKAWAVLAGGRCSFQWHGRGWTLPLPAALPDVLFVTVQGVAPEPAGDLLLVVRRKPGVLDLVRRPSVRGHAARAAAH